MWWYKPLLPTLRRHRQGDPCEFVPVWPCPHTKFQMDQGSIEIERACFKRTCVVNVGFYFKVKFLSFKIAFNNCKMLPTSPCHSKSLQHIYKNLKAKDLQHTTRENVLLTEKMREERNKRSYSTIKMMIVQGKKPVIYSSTPKLKRQSNLN